MSGPDSTSVGFSDGEKTVRKRIKKKCCFPKTEQMAVDRVPKLSSSKLMRKEQFQCEY